MNYAQCIERLFQASASIKMHDDLSLMRALDQLLGHPSQSFPTIHVAGSNGKGSVSLKIARALQAVGYRVGLYTSPHLYTFRERIQCNGVSIEEEAVVDYLAPIFLAEEELQVRASFFELTTLLAFSYFRDSVDIAVIETGLGGRLDATNLIHPVCTVITSISREHTSILGEELEQIAAEKAGIIKPRVPLILGPKARFASIEARARALEAPLLFSDKVGSFYDEENSAIAECVLRQLDVPEEAMRQGCAMRPPCRFEVQDDVVFDVAHNPDAFEHLVRALQRFFPQRKLRFVVGFSSDKDYKQCLERIFPIAEHIHLVQADSLRAAPPEVLARCIKETPYTLHASVQEGVGHARTAALASGALLVIAGSFYIMAAAKKALGSYALMVDTLPLSDAIQGSSSLRTSASPIKKSSTSSGLGSP